MQQDQVTSQLSTLFTVSYSKINVGKNPITFKLTKDKVKLKPAFAPDTHTNDSSL